MMLYNTKEIESKTGEASSATSSATTADDSSRCKELLNECEMFQALNTNHIATLAGLMKTRVFQQNDVLLKQGEASSKFFLIDHGDIRRKFVSPDNGKVHNVEFDIKAASIGSMRIFDGERVYATVQCMSESCKLYEMARNDFLGALQKEPEIATRIAEGLCKEIRTGSRKYATPLLQQQQQDVNIPAVAIAAGIESYYRSALNALLNARLTGVRAELFPNMHIQVPTRISYIVGFKTLRQTLEKNLDADDYSHPNLVRLAQGIAPGVIMTPISSVLEASNAGHMNPESITTRWMRGVVPRCGREIIFGLGLNQMSDYFEERLTPFFGNKLLANAAGSLTAGVVSGYFSHVPHNMSTLKLLEPNKGYGELYRKFVDKSTPPAVDQMLQRQSNLSPFAKKFTRYAFATLFPRGLVIRTTQIVGSFIILNGTINFLGLQEERKIRMALHQR